ncbi:MAG TPA: translocation/assembly module TamB domain-containing protein, partial [Leptolyngbyaceae cyanobacterium M65_K2018_010]|nr:translocation/assembly module TamB domain-containing protein [Leptolyngbyaceae cyanobacterium M65_K2018_010]
TRLSLVGQVSAQDSNLTIQAESVPLTAAANLLETPFEVNGLLNLKANLTGSYTNPNLVGSFAVDQASINQQDIQDISSTFQYQDAYFSLSGRILGPAAEPLLFSGRVPYALPFMTVKPEGNEIALQASLKDEALSLVSVITPELLWGGGTARIDLRIGGSLSRPLANGQITFDQATFNLPSFEVSLNNLSGDIQLLGTQVQVGSLTGNLLDGNFALTGNLPLTIRDVSPTDQGFQLALDNIHLEFFNEVSSYINGTLTVTNALLAPTLGGDVRLQNTQVTVGPQLLNLVQDLRRQTSVAEIRADLARVTRIFPVRVKDLQVALEPTLVKAPPLLSFNLQGALALSGPIPGLYANGRIDLEEGWVNTITAEFFLQNGYDNVILFRPEYKLDPYLDLVMEASVPLQRSYAINRPQITEGAAEIPAIDRLGSNTIFDELLIEARVKGLASRFFENLQLTSNPPYSQTQLLSMVSGGYLSDLGGAEPSLALGANLITALTADTQDAIGRALGVRRFRLGASTIQPTPTGDTFGYGLGLNLGISDNLSLNFVQVLNQAQPSQLNARYRFDQHWSLEGSSSLGDDHRIFVRYRLSF